MLIEEYKSSVQKAKEELLSEMNERGYWLGKLSASPVSTAVSAIALYFADKTLYAEKIEKALGYLESVILENGGFGDAPSAKANPTATILAICAFYLYKENHSATLEKSKAYLGGDWTSPKQIRDSVLSIYGDDLTFSAPILAVCVGVGLLGENAWELVPKLPYQLAIVPQKFFAMLNLPMVSYAIPALVCVGICRDFLSRKKVSKIKKKLAEILLNKVSNMQPSSGGFLEASPLTSFCIICLALCGYKEHSIAKKGLEFIEREQRSDGSWAIDTNLCQWLTSLSVDALKGDYANKEATLKFFEANVWSKTHDFTMAKAGAFSWTNTDGGVPDADDTSAALVALFYLKEAKADELVENAIEWLLGLQNKDGGMPTFCKGWNKLPFDKSCADISAHAIKAFSFWKDFLNEDLKARVHLSMLGMIKYLERSQNEDGSWVSLWFGENDLEGGVSKVLSTAIVLEHTENILQSASKARDFLLKQMHPNGTWGGIDENGAKYVVTARCVSALAKICKKEPKLDIAISAFLKMEEKSEVIGLYFAKLWYSEKLYSKIFSLNAKKNSLRYLINYNEI